MLDRLYASMSNGAAMNCRPHHSRQRIDLTQLDQLADLEPTHVLRELIAGQNPVRVSANVPTPPNAGGGGRFLRDANDEQDAGQEGGAVDVEAVSAMQAWSRQRRLLSKARTIVDDTRTYTQDTGVEALYLGFPILSLPPGAMGPGSSRVLAPVGLVPVSLEVKGGGRAGLELACRGEGDERVMPNLSLLAFIERHTGKAVGELFEDDDGSQAWAELRELTAMVCSLLEMDPPGILEALDEPESLELRAVPRSDGLGDQPGVLASAVLGLFPLSQQSLLRDTRAMLAADRLVGPVRRFIEAGVDFDAVPIGAEDAQEGGEGDESEAARQARERAEHEASTLRERLVARADPCQRRAVAAARSAEALIVHGPPGTGKSQTISNIISDHLARGERVLFVCDKRTALDVVQHRLDKVGLGELCALVHDPQRDRRDLYMGLRKKLDELPDAARHPRAAAAVEKLDNELAALRDELREDYAAVMKDTDGRGSFHDCVGRWMTATVAEPASHAVRELSAEEFEKYEQALEVALQRGAEVGWAENPWIDAAGVTLEAWMTRAVEPVRASLAAWRDAAEQADATAEDALVFETVEDLQTQRDRRMSQVDGIRELEGADPAVVAAAAGMEPAGFDALAGQVKSLSQAPGGLASGPMDASLAAVAAERSPSVAVLATQVAILEDYLEHAGRWWAFIRFGAKKRASAVLRDYGLTLSPDAAVRVRTLLTGLRARLSLQALRRSVVGDAAQEGSVEADHVLQAFVDAVERVDTWLDAVRGDAAVEPVGRMALENLEARAELAARLDQSVVRADRLLVLEAGGDQADVVDQTWKRARLSQVRQGGTFAETAGALHDQLATLEAVLRAKQTLDEVPFALRSVMREMLDASADPGIAMDSLRRGVLRGRIDRMLRDNPKLATLDRQRIENSLDRLLRLEDQRRPKVAQMVLDLWHERQQAHLLSNTGTRLNGAGAALRQRLYVRGQKALRLRKMVQVGRTSAQSTSEDVDLAGAGDPLFDMCPVWMASPETVAQVLPPEAVFDTLIFDEASQCKLEEALPVLQRARRVVIAGDPKQLPPTRFFESAFVTSDDMEIDTEQELFEAQQTQVEDLLAAALNLDLESAYLDVHYRSQNADLIEFSNQHFYGDRLQAIPGHPRNRTRVAPVSLLEVPGVYEDRGNDVEAARVVDLVNDLLRLTSPPSIGIACFNVVQQDVINEKLAERAEEDKGFAARLAVARQRQGDGGFEGLFVKNLENVQGDERDHIIISTTYGPNEEGRFYRRFGPLGRAGGGRRLNVLVTRARQKVHLVTSIPREAYLHAEPLPAGATPNGGWLLFAYLRYASDLDEAYEENHRILEAASASEAATVWDRKVPGTGGASGQGLGVARGVAAALAQRFGWSSDVPLGNAGFCIDAALHHPTRPQDVTLGVLTDFTRYDNAADPVEWDAYRVGIMQAQGWRLHRVWSPQLMRDATGCLDQVAAEVRQELEADA